MLRRITLIAGAVLCVAALAVPAVAHAAVVPYSLAELAERADAIVVVKVGTERARHARPALPGSGVPIVTDTSLAVSRILKGQRPNELTLTQLGGRVGTERLEVSELPNFVPGQRAIVFLNSQGGVVGGYQGVLTVERGRIPALGLSLPEAERIIRRLGGANPPLLGPSPIASSLTAEPDAAPISSASLSAAAAPAIASALPAGANAGVNEWITIRGTGFGDSEGEVSFGHGLSLMGTDRAYADVVSWSDTQIVVAVPRYAQTRGDLRVVAADGSSGSKAYSVGFSTDGRTFNTIPVTYRINENTGDMSGEGAALQAALATWSGAGSLFRAQYGGTSARTSNPPTANNANDVFWASSGFGDPGILAWNVQWYSGSKMYESDIVFNDAYSWTNGASSGKFDLQSVALHELGHTVGLDDQYGDISKVMGAASSNATKRALTAPEVNGALHLYGADAGSPPSAPIVGSFTHVNGAWSKVPAATFTFQATDDKSVAGYSYALDQATTTVPDAVSDGASTAKSYGGLEDGTWYFHVRAVDSDGMWGPASHFCVRVDTTAPMTVHDGLASYFGTATVHFTATDAGSGVSATEYRVDGGTWAPGSVATVGQVGEHVLEFRSRDAAGNEEPAGSLSLQVVAPLPESAATSLLLDSRNSVLAPAYGARGTARVTLTTANASKLSGRTVYLEKTDGSLVATFSPVAGTEGTYSVRLPLVNTRTEYRARFGGEEMALGSSTPVVVRPKAYLKVTSPSAATRYRTFTVTGVIKPTHARASLKIEVWKRNRVGSWVRYKTYNAYGYGTSFTKNLAYAPGAYRIRAIHEDTGHSRSYSGFDYTMVR